MLARKTQTAGGPALRRTTVTLAITLLLLFSSTLVGISPVAAEAEPDDIVRAIVTYQTFDDVPTDAELQNDGLVALYRYVSIPAVVVNGTTQDIDAQAGTPGFAGIEYDREVSYFMDTATFATRAAEVWQDTWWPGSFPNDFRDPLTLPDGTPIDGTNITIGVVDSGINAMHPDLWYSPAHVDGMPWTPKVEVCVNSPTVPVSNPYCDQTVGHGTHVAGIAAGTGWAARNGLTHTQRTEQPYVGAAPGTKLAVAGMGAAVLVVDATTSLDWMYANRHTYGIDIVTNSWGDIVRTCNGALPGGSVISITNKLVDAGIPVLFAAGNYFPDPLTGDDRTYTSTYARNPYPGVITVANYVEGGAGGRNGAISSGSSDGCVKPGNGSDDIWSWPDLAAPGTSIVSTAAYTGTVIAPTWNPPFYASAGGTSMATPHVAGIVALMKQANPDLTPAQIEKILIDSATPWTDGTTSRGVSGTTMWGTTDQNNPNDGFTDDSLCKVKPLHAAQARDGDSTVNAIFPRYTQLADITDPDLYICRDYRRGNGLVDAYAAVSEALALRTDTNNTTGEPTVTIDTPADNAQVPAGPIAVGGVVDRLGTNEENQFPTAALSVNPSSGKAPLAVNFTIGGSDSDGTIASWTLDFGDGTDTAGTGALPATNVAHTYQSNGEHTAELTVIDDDGAAASATVTLTVGGLPDPDGTIEAEVFAYNAGGVGGSNVIATATGLLVNDDVPKYVAGETVTISARSSSSTNPSVPVDAGTFVQLFIFDETGNIVMGPTMMNGAEETGVFACDPTCYSYGAGSVTIPDDWAGRYYLAPRATIDGVDYWFYDRGHGGLKKIDVIGTGDVPPSADDDAGHDIGDPNNDATSPFTEIQWADSTLTSSDLTVTIKLQQAGTPAGDSPFLYGIVVNGLDLEVYVLGFTSVWDVTNGQAVAGGSAVIDPVANTVTAQIPRAYLDSLGKDCPCFGHVESRIGEGQAGGLVADDRAPDAGSIELRSPLVPNVLGEAHVPTGAEADPEAQDPADDASGANLAWMDITKLWIDAETATTFDVTLQVRDMAELPPSSSTGPVVATNYGAEFCTDSDGQSYNPDAANGYANLNGVVCYRLGAQRGALGDSFGAGVIQKDGTGSCGYQDAIDTTESRFDQAASTVTWRVFRLALNADTISGAVGDCNGLTPPTRNGVGAVDGTTISRLRGSTGNTFGVAVPGGGGATGTSGAAGDTTDGAQARPYTLGVVSPVSVSAGGPYSGAIDTPITVTGNVGGGTAPYTCTWSGTGATFADPNACSGTTVTFASGGTKTVTLTATDSSSPAEEASDDATVTVTDGTTGERVDVYLDTESTPRLSVPVMTDDQATSASWSDTVDLTGLSGAHTLTARWLDADGSELDNDTITVHVDGVTGVPFVDIDEPADDPSGQNPLQGTIPVSGTAGHTDGTSGTAAGLNFHGFPLASGSRGGLRATTQDGPILAPCNLCHGEGDTAGLGADTYLATSVTWATGPTNNGVDGWWFDISGLGGGTYTLESEFGDPMDVFFFQQLDDASSIGRNQGSDMPKTGSVPADATWAFVYNRLPGDGVGFADTAILTVAPQVVVPSAPQGLVATPGPELISLDWTPPANDGGEAPIAYNVYRDGALLTTTGAVLSYTDTGRTAGVEHTYAVAAVNGAGEGVKSDAVTAAALGTPPALAVTAPTDGATGVPADTTIDGTYAPQSDGGGTPGVGNFANTHYVFLYNLNSACGDPLGYGDHLIASKLIAHAQGVLGVPESNIHFYNEYGVPLDRAVDAQHYDRLPAEFKSGQNPFSGRASPATFEAAMHAVAEAAAAGEAAGGAPARLFLMHSSHGLWNPANLLGPGPLAEEDRYMGSMMCLVGEAGSNSAADLQDYEFGRYITEAVDGAEATHAGVDIELAILVDCSFCGGFGDSPFWMPGTTTTPVDSANVVGDNRVVEVGCTWITECFGNPAVTYDHIFNECLFKDAADGYGPVLIDDLIVPSATHHAPNGVITLEEAYWCSLESVRGGGEGFGQIDPIGIQQMFQLVDNMSADLFGDDGFVLWDIGADQNLGGRDRDQPLAATLPDLRVTATDEEGDALAPYTDLLQLEASATSTHAILDLSVADLTLSSAEVEDLVEYNFFVNGDRIGVCYTLGAVEVYNYNLGPEGARLPDAVATYDFASGVVHLELPLTDLNDGTLPADVYAESWTGRPCNQGAIQADDRVPNSGTIATSAEDDPVVDPGTDQVRVRLDGPGGEVINGNAALNATAGTWSFDPVGALANGTWTAEVSHFFDPGTGTFSRVEGPLSIAFSVGAGNGTDTQPPSQVTGVTGTAGVTTIELAWTAATDNVAVDHYAVYRGATAGFTPGAANRVGVPTDTSFVDTGLVPETTYHYRIEAVDAAGNRGTLSAEVSVTTQAEPAVTEMVSLFVDDATVPFDEIPVDSSASGTASWSSDLDTLTLADGQHTLRAEYDDGEGGSATATVTFHTANFLDIEITAPTDGSDVDKDFTVSGTTAGTDPGAAQGASLLLPDGTLNEAHFAIQAMSDPAFALIDSALSGEPGFSSLSPALDGSPVLHAAFEGAVPEQLPLHLLPAGWRLQAHADVTFDALRTEHTDVVDLGPRAPVPAPTMGIGPGSVLISFFDGVVGICTANFVWEDETTGKLYLGAAGHCFMPETLTSTHGADKDWDASRTTVFACNNTCLGGASGLGLGAVGLYDVADGFVPLGPLAYARQTIGTAPLGNDFGVVEIPDNLRPLVRTSMMVWEGPTHEAVVQRGDVTVHYGNSVGMGEVFPTKARVGMAYREEPTFLRALHPIAQGDSGSAMNVGAVDGNDVLRGAGAAGIITHISDLCCTIDAAGPPNSIAVATTTERAIVMAQEADLNLRMMTEDDDPTNVGPTPPSAPRNLAPTRGDAQVHLTWSAPVSDGGSPITGYTVKYGTSAGGPYTDSQAASTTEATIAGLTNGQAYHFVVSASNAEGEGPVSDEVSATPNPDPEVPDAPTNLTAMAGDGQVSLSWQAPSNNGSPITGYQVKYGTAAGGPYTGVKNAADTMTTVTGLTNGQVYFFTVSATNAVGEGPDANETHATPQEGGGSIYSVQVRALQNGSAVADWAPADRFDGATWGKDYADMPSGELTVEARLIRSGGQVVATDTVTVTVMPINDAPLADAGDDVTVDEGTDVTLDASASSDPEGDALSFTWTQLAGTSVALDGADTSTPSFTVPNVPAHEDMVFRVTVTDTGGRSATDHVVVSVRDLHEVAAETIDGVAIESAVAGNLSETVTVAGIHHLANGGDGATAFVEFQVVEAGTVPTSGAWTGATTANETWSFDWDTFPLVNGDYDVHVRLLANTTEVVADVFTASVHNEHPPVLDPIGDQTVDENQTLTVPVSASDLDGHALAITATGVPAGATFVDNGDGTASLDWATTYDDAGVYTVTVNVTDPTGFDVGETFDITVVNVNRAPTMDDVPDQTTDEMTELTLDLSALDPDGDALTLSAADLPPGASFVDQGDGTGTFSWRPDSTQAGTHEVTFTATDGALSVQDVVTITVNDVQRMATSSNGREYTSVTTAIDEAVSGDEIRLEPLTHTEAIVVDVAGITLCGGTADGSACLDTYGDVVVGVSGGVGVAVTAADVQVESIVFDGNSEAVHALASGLVMLENHLRSNSVGVRVGPVDNTLMRYNNCELSTQPCVAFTSGTTGRTVDARYNDWSVYNSLLVGTRVSASGNTVMQNPYLNG